MQHPARLAKIFLVVVPFIAITSIAAERESASTTRSREGAPRTVLQPPPSVQSPDRSSRGSTAAPKNGSTRQPAPRSAADLNRTPVRAQPQNTQARLQAALAAVEKSEQSLKFATNAMTAYLDREATCLGKTWSAGEMDKGCKQGDTLTLCKEKLIAACATGRGPGKQMLWSNVKNAAADLGQKAQAVTHAYNESNDNLNFPAPGVGGIGGSPF